MSLRSRGWHMLGIWNTREWVNRWGLYAHETIIIINKLVLFYTTCHLFSLLAACASSFELRYKIKHEKCYEFSTRIINLHLALCLPLHVANGAGLGSGGRILHAKELNNYKYTHYSRGVWMGKPSVYTEHNKCLLKFDNKYAYCCQNFSWESGGTK